MTLADPIRDREDPSGAPLAKLKIGANGCAFERRADGGFTVRSRQTVSPRAAVMTDCLARYAAEAPERVFIAERDEAGEWRKVTYAQAFRAVQAIGSALLARKVSPERPAMLLSGNDIEHALLALACLHIGLPYSPVSPAYSTLDPGFSKLLHIAGKLTPGLVFASDGAMFAAAIRAAAPADAEIIVTKNAPADRAATLFSALLDHPVDEDAVARAHSSVKREHVAKILFTSGSTALPKGVINTQGMWAANQEQIASFFPFVRDEPPVIIDWLPWSHTFGGNKNFGLILYNGGSLYIDDGRPTPKGIKATIRNLREIAPTIYFNVPKGFEELVPYLRAEPALRQKFYSRLNMYFFAGAGLNQHVWDEMDRASVEELGARVPMMTGLGATETGPFALACPPDHCRSGYVGLPVPGVELKLTPVEGKLEARVRGPAITPGYWRNPEATAKAFDEEGFYRLGDALSWIDEADFTKGLRFNGRIAEDFKLSSGTWVSVGPLRARIVSHFAPYIRDVVIAGLNRDDIGALAVPDWEALAALCPAVGARDVAALARSPEVRARLSALLASLAQSATGSSTLVARLMLLEEPPSLEKGEITDKGSLNQRAMLDHRAALVEELYADPASPGVIALREMART